MEEANYFCLLCSLVSTTFFDVQERPIILPNAFRNLISDLSMESLDFHVGSSTDLNLYLHLETCYTGSLVHLFLMILVLCLRMNLARSFELRFEVNETHISSSHDISASWKVQYFIEKRGFQQDLCSC